MAGLKKKILAILAAIGIGAAGTMALGASVSVPSAPGANYVLLSTSTGNYMAVATSSLGITSGGTPGGSNTQVQFNDSGVFGGSSDFVFNSAGRKITITSNLGSVDLFGSNLNASESFNLTGGSTSTASGGSISIQGGNATGGNNAGGSVNITSGNGSGSESPGDIYIQNGTGGSGNGHEIFISTGNSDSYSLIADSYYELFTDISQYHFSNGVSRYGILDFSGVNTLDRTFYAPNQTGAWALASTSAAGLWQTFTANQNRLGLGTSTPFAKFSIHANNGETNTTLFSIASSTQTATTTFFRITNRGDIITNAATPTLNSCGTATITSTSTDMRGTISVTAGTPTTCNITYSSRKSDTPTCVASDNNPALAVAINLASTTGVQFGMSAVFSGNIHYICLQ